jgi:hypothetical protein
LTTVSSELQQILAPFDALPFPHKKVSVEGSGPSCGFCGREWPCPTQRLIEWAKGADETVQRASDFLRLMFDAEEAYVEVEQRLRDAEIVIGEYAIRNRNQYDSIEILSQERACLRRDIAELQEKNDNQSRWINELQEQLVKLQNDASQRKALELMGQYPGASLPLGASYGPSVPPKSKVAAPEISFEAAPGVRVKVSVIKEG